MKMAEFHKPEKKPMSKKWKSQKIILTFFFSYCLKYYLKFIDYGSFWTLVIQPFKCQPHKMVKHTQTVRWEQQTNCLSVFEHFVGLALKGLNWRTGKPKEQEKNRKNQNRKITLWCWQHPHNVSWAFHDFIM